MKHKKININKATNHTEPVLVSVVRNQQRIPILELGDTLIFFWKLLRHNAEMSRTKLREPLQQRFESRKLNLAIW